MYTHTHTHKQTNRIRTDHNEDNTTAMLQEWSQNAKGTYASINFGYSDAWLYPTFNAYDMPDERYLHMAQLKQQALDAAREIRADYLFVSDGEASGRWPSSENT